jgi:hypothetical protein
MIVSEPVDCRFEQNFGPTVSLLCGCWIGPHQAAHLPRQVFRIDDHRQVFGNVVSCLRLVPRLVSCLRIGAAAEGENGDV